MKIRTILLLFFIGLITGPAFAAGQSVTLSWTASVSSTTATPGTSNVYREIGTCSATQPTSTAGFSQIATNIAPSGPYTDTAVTMGTTYCYIVTAVIGGLESAPSNTFQAIIPSLPSPPTGLKGTITP
jgi:hypothetical protein